MDVETIVLPTGETMERKVYSKYTEEELRRILAACKNLAQVITVMKLHRSYNRYLKTFITNHEIDTSHFILSKKKNSIQMKDILVEKCERTINSYVIKKYLITENLVKHECAVCKLPPLWNEKPLTLQLDHINGNHYDNRVENLRLICPNCHSQTDTFTGRNLRIYKKKQCSDCSKKLQTDNSTGKCATCIGKEKHLCTICKVNKRPGHNTICTPCKKKKIPKQTCKGCQKEIKRMSNTSGYHKKCYKSQKNDEKKEGSIPEP